MRILLVNKFHYIKGGSETYYFSLKELLEKHGHEVIEFSMKDNQNIPSKYSEYFVESIDYNKKQSLYNKIKLAGKLIFSFEAQNKLENLIKDYNPDIAHLNIFQHQLSPSILSTLKKYNIPIVYTAHDLKMICPNYKMLVFGEICEQCRKQKYYNCLKNKCVKNSYMKTIVNVIEAYTHKILNSYALIDKIITPSDFYRKKFIEFGVKQERIKYIPNFIDADKYVPNYEFDDYCLYFGRLSEEKGIITLVKSMKNVDFKLKIVGTGPMDAYIKKLIKSEGINDKIEILGFKQGEELIKLVSKAMCVVVPSEWYENAPYTILEAMALGKLVIGSRIGGITELLEDGLIGLNFIPGSIEDLSNKINYIIENKHLVKRYGENARKKIKIKFNEKLHYEQIMDVYKQLLS
ncbi:glycosyltransferase family 4 protein [Clostridium arbusti]|uniref:glycosyltransferase family 4 protein n=1 Tax=Clostridium arbusti TaxID=1137848 RepID=UPI000288E707|nr:glycosyltransferase family 4 protein [Clostridium arbusti]